MRTGRGLAVAGAVLAVLVVVGGGPAGGGARRGGPPAPAPPSAPRARVSSPPRAGWAPPAGFAPPAAFTPPPVNAGFDYQIGEPYRPPAGVSVVSRDHDATPAAGLYNICYVNGFQTQTEAADWWQRTHADLILRRAGKPVVDGDWNEMLLDIGTAAKRDALARIVDGWIDQCAAKGFRGLEIDNLDSYSRSKGLLKAADALAYARLLADHAHVKGLAVGQKNTVELATAARGTFDFAIAEECADYSECQGYIDAYGDHVIVIEYDTTHFRQACAGYGTKLSIVRRARNATAPGPGSYAFASC